MAPDAFQRLLDFLKNLFCDPTFDKCIELISAATMAQRSELVRLARSGVFVIQPRTVLVNMLIQEWSYSELRLLSYMNGNPLYQSLLLNLSIWAPMSEAEFKQSKDESYQKELSVLLRPRRDTGLCFDAFFYPCDTPIFSDAPLNLSMASIVRNAIHDWARSLQDKILYPKHSEKTMSRATTKEVRRNVEFPEDIDEEISSSYYEYLEHHGIPVIESPMEMRQRLYPGFLKPRTYYANGATSHRLSRYIGREFSDLADRLVSSNRYTSVRPDRLRSMRGFPAFIYDLTSFTSNLDIHSRFLYEMAYALRGYTTWVFSSERGLVNVYLSDLIEDLALGHDHPVVSLECILGDDILIDVGPAGLLGMNGNIQSARFIHASIMLQFVENENELNVAGDDGIIITNDPIRISKYICFMGSLQFEKCYTTDQSGCICLKRSLQQINTGFVHGTLASLPNFELPVSRKYVDLRYPDILRKTKTQRKEAAAASVLTSISSMYPEIRTTNFEEKFTQIVKYYYAYAGLKMEGNVPQFQDMKLPFIVPIQFIEMHDPRSYTLTTSYPGYAFLPTRGILTEDYESLWIIGSSALQNSSKYLKQMELFGYLTRKRQYNWILGHEGLELLKVEYMRQKPPAIYLFECICTIPTVFRDLDTSVSFL